MRSAVDVSALTGLLDNLPSMVYRCRNDWQWTMEYVGAFSAELTGYAPAELVDNQTVAYGDLIYPDDREPVWEAVQEAIRN